MAAVYYKMRQYGPTIEQNSVAAVSSENIDLWITAHGTERLYQMLAMHGTAEGGWLASEQFQQATKKASSPPFNRDGTPWPASNIKYLNCTCYGEVNLKLAAIFQTDPLFQTIAADLGITINNEYALNEFISEKLPPKCSR